MPQYSVNWGYTTIVICGLLRSSPPVMHTIAKNSYVDGHAFAAWGLFLRSVRHLWVLGCPLNANGWLVQAATLLEITTWLVDDIGHGFSYINFCDSLSAIGLLVDHFTLKIAELSCNPPLRGSPPPPSSTPICACGVDKSYLKWREIQLALHCGKGSLIDLE